MTEADSPTGPQTGVPAGANRLSALRFILVFGAVSGLADFVYEGARSIVGPYLATFGASGALVGVVSGGGEAVATVFRLFTGRLSDRTGRYWSISITGYAITIVSVPLLAAAGPLWLACVFVIGERFGKAVRTPARDTMLAEASTSLGRGRAFAFHEALDQAGALVGPLVIAAILATHHAYKTGFAWLAIPGALALLTLGWLRRQAPSPAAYDPAVRPAQAPRAALRGFSRLFWQYALFSAATLAGFATFAVMAYHLQRRHVVGPAQIPAMYALAMGVAAVSALGSGRAYDRFGLRGLAVLPPLGVAIPFLSFSTSAALVWVGAALWGAATGVHESTMRAAVADLVPRQRRGEAYGTFTTVYGLAWLAGAAVIGALYDVSIDTAIDFVLAVQAVALLFFFPLWRTSRAHAKVPDAG
jgi:MFS family permease